MEKSSFFNAIIGQNGTPDRAYLAEDFAKYFSTFIGNGVFPNPANQLQVIAIDNNMQIRIKAGLAWINGYFYENTDDCIFKLDPADGVLNRIDRIALRLDFLERRIKAVVKKGQYGSNPIASALQRDADAYELCLANIRVSKGVTSITQANITDTRLSTELCGIVHGLVDQVDTEVLFQDYQSWIAQKKDEYNTDLIDYTTNKQDELDTWYNTTTTDFENAFNTWFTTIQGILDENAAGNLLSMINENTSQIQQVNERTLVKNIWGLNLLSNKAENWVQGYINTTGVYDDNYGQLVTDKITGDNYNDSNCNITTKDFFDIDPRKKYIIRHTGHFDFPMYFSLALYDENNNFIDDMDVNGQGVLERLDENVQRTPVLPSNAKKAKLTIRREWSGSSTPYTPISPQDIEGANIKLEEGKSIDDFTEWTANINDIADNIDFKRIVVGIAPKNPEVGTLWADINNGNNLYCYDGVNWVFIGFYKQRNVANVARDNEKKLEDLTTKSETHLAESVADGVHGMGSIASQDYEEGTWTPEIAGTEVPGSHTYENQDGRYKRIGGMIIAKFRVKMSKKDTTMSGRVIIKGLPFKTSPDLFYDANIGHYIGLSGANGYGIFGYVNPGSSHILIMTGSNDRASQISSDIVTDITQFIGEMTYFLKEEKI